jgi:outer membrane protein TolC
MFQTGASSMLDVIEASRSWFISWRESGIRGPELVQAAEAYRNTMSRLLELQTERVHKGASNQADLASAEYGLAEAEFWLEEARSK